MAPEQLTDPKGVDWRADIYSLGVILFELLTDRRPFSGATAALLCQRVLEDPAPTPSSIDPTVPKAFDAVVLAALTKRREERTQSVAELRKAVTALNQPPREKKKREKVRESTRRAKKSPAVSAAPSASEKTEPATQGWFARNKLAFLIGLVVATLFWLPVVVLFWFNS
jgi:serine/threonine-protein kinase